MNTDQIMHREPTKMGPSESANGSQDSSFIQAKERTREVVHRKGRVSDELGGPILAATVALNNFPDPQLQPESNAVLQN
jgi:hypothetical protein